MKSPSEEIINFEKTKPNKAGWLVASGVRELLLVHPENMRSNLWTTLESSLRMGISETLNDKTNWETFWNRMP